MASSTTLTLNTGAKMPVLGLGTWGAKPGEVKAAVESAIDAGYRHIDCAYLYQNESEIGDAIQCKIKEGKIKREDLFITSKLWVTCFRRPREGIDESLRRLKLNYVDLYLMHFPFALEYTTPEEVFPFDENGKARLDEGIHYIDVWKEMEKFQKEGLAKAIGISNFNEFQIKKLWKEVEIKPAVHQYEIHPYLDQENLLQFCKSKGLVVTGYSPFGSPGRPWAQPGDPNLLQDPNLKKMGEKYGKTVAQVLLRYQLQRGTIVIPKSANPGRIKSNSEIFDFSLSEEDMLEIKKEDRNWRAVSIEMFKGHKYFPYNDNYSE